MPKVKEGRGSRSTRPAGRTSAKAPVAAPAKPARPAAKAPAARSMKAAVTGRKAVVAKAAAPKKAGASKAVPAKAKTRGSRPLSAKARKATKAVQVLKTVRGGKALPKAKLKLEPVRGVKIKELNPQEKCGPGTSVLQLFRVDESLGKDLTTHLVFFDRHGWYCEHGRTCRAVTDVQKLGKRMVMGL